MDVSGGREPTGSPPPDVTADGVSGLIRLLLRWILTAAITGVVTLVLWRHVSGTLSGRTSSVGYAIAVDFDINRYTDAYLLLAFVVPAVALVSYLLMRRWGPLAVRRGNPKALLPVVLAPDSEDPDQSSLPLLWFWALARCTLPALAVVLELSTGTSSLQQRLSTRGWVAGVGYLVVVALAAAAVVVRRRRQSSNETGDAPRPSWMAEGARSISRANGVVALLTVPLLYLASRATALEIDSTHRVVGYPWLPVWLAGLLTLAAVGAYLRWHRRSAPADQREVESNVLVWVVGPVLLFITMASLPGALGTFQAFDDAHFLASPQLLFAHGLFPWRDLYLIHGMLNDGLSAVLGFAVFGKTRWGGFAGLSIYVDPCFWLAMYAFAATFCRKNRLVLLGLGLLMVVGTFQTNSPELLVVPLCFLLLASALRRPTWGRCIALTVGVFASAVLVPETTLFQIGILPLVVVFEWCTRQPGVSRADAFGRTWRCAVVAVISVAAFVLYLVATGSLSAFFDFYVVFASDNAIIHGLPVQWPLGTNLLYTFFLWAPVPLWLFVIVRMVAKLLRRSGLSILDWVMVAAALDDVLYFIKVVQRADGAHVVQCFEATLPLLFLWAIVSLEWVDGWVRRAFVSLAGRRPGLASSLRHPVSVAALAAVAIVAPFSAATLQAVPAHFHPTSPVAASGLPRLGYVLPGTVDASEIVNLAIVLDRYAGPFAPIMDFANEPGIVYYLLNRVPATRFTHIDEAGTLASQRQAIAQIRTSRPPVVVFSAVDFGSTLFDGLPTMVRQYAISTYLLDHYRPLANVQGQLLLLRDDLAAHPAPMPVLDPPARTTNLYFSSFGCNLHDIPNFLTEPSDLGTRPGVTATFAPTSVPGTWRVVLPPGLNLASYPYLQVRSAAPLGHSAFAFSNAVGAPPSNLVQFSAVPRSGHRLDVDVGDCLQWHGYQSSSLYLTVTTPTPPTLRLVR
jgi:hypothetical protein